MLSFKKPSGAWFRFFILAKQPHIGISGYAKSRSLKTLFCFVRSYPCLSHCNNKTAVKYLLIVFLGNLLRFPLLNYPVLGYNLVVPDCSRFSKHLFEMVAICSHYFLQYSRYILYCQVFLPKNIRKKGYFYGLEQNNIRNRG